VNGCRKHQNFYPKSCRNAAFTFNLLKHANNPFNAFKAICIPSNIVDQVENAIQGKDCTFSGFVIAAVRAALDDLDKDAK